MAAYAEGACSQHAAVFDVGLCALLVEDVEQHAIFSLAGHDHHVFEVLCSGAYQRYSANVYLSIMSASEAPLATVCSKG